MPKEEERGVWNAGNIIAAVYEAVTRGKRISEEQENDSEDQEVSAVGAGTAHTSLLSDRANGTRTRCSGALVTRECDEKLPIEQSSANPG